MRLREEQYASASAPAATCLVGASTGSVQSCFREGVAGNWNGTFETLIDYLQMRKIIHVRYNHTSFMDEDILIRFNIITNHFPPTAPTSFLKTNGKMISS